MIGQQIGVGVNGTIIAAMLLPGTASRAVILVDTERERSRYVTARVFLTRDGLPASREWDAGIYKNDLAEASADMVQRALASV